MKHRIVVEIKDLHFELWLEEKQGESWKRLDYIWAAAWTLEELNVEIGKMLAREAGLGL